MVERDGASCLEPDLLTLPLSVQGSTLNVRYATVPGETYNIHVQGATPEDIGEFDLTVTGVTAAGGQVPGDCNQDQDLDVSDASCLLGFLFLGRPGDLPCGDGSGDDPGNIVLADCNSDDQLDLSDGVCILNHLFNGRPPPAGGASCLLIEGCPESCVR